MAASPQRASSTMGAASLRLRLLQQEEQARLQRFRRLQTARVDPQHEARSREAARARARELERSVGGGSVGGCGGGCGVGGGVSGNAMLGGGAVQRPLVFELPANQGIYGDDDGGEDVGLAMKATSYPGQEWVPVVWED